MSSRRNPQQIGAELARERERDRFHDECGVFGIHGHVEAANHAYLGLYALQHRGQESAGIASSNGHEHFVHRGMGLVADVFSEEVLRRLPGRHAVGHVRYSTAGQSTLRNAQPFCATTDGGPVALAHNGNLVNAVAIRQELEGRGAIFSSTSDSEVIVHLLARSREAAPEERLIDSLSRVRGAWSLVMLTADALIAARDPWGFRPLTLGRLDGAWVVASETCALDLIGAETERDVEPGEVLVVRRGRMRALGVTTCTPFASNSGEPWLANIPCARTWWFRCSTRETRRPWATPRSRAFRTKPP
jgi:amidophosphoribosyltransferase